MYNNRRGIIVSLSFFFYKNANWKTASKIEKEWISISRGHLISRRRSIFFPIVLDTFYYSLWCWYTDRGSVLEGLLSPFTFSILFSQHNSRRYRRQTGQLAAAPPLCDTINTQLYSFAIMLTPYLIHTYMETHALARIHVRACTNFLVFLFPTPFLFHARRIGRAP